LEEKAERLDVNAEFLGFVPEDELPAFYAALDLFLFPSLWEGFGVPIVEAMACGTPVAAIDHKGPAELVEDGRSGFLLSRDPDDWTAVLREFIGDDRSMRESARHRAEQFSWERAARQYEEKLMELAE
ncbi:MAG: glycosyltransferase, partial [Candidatus Nanohaloarchaea archaeon]|nr:glycosyltransferase [Candidatus Nanohaloarchaea archaeon]